MMPATGRTAVRSRFQSALRMQLFLFLAWTMQFAASPVADACLLPSGQLTDQQIDSVGDQVMQHNDFRSMRRRLQDPLPAADPDKGFLNQVGDWIGELFGSMFDSIGSFFDWLFSSNQQPRPTTQRQATNSSGGGSSMNGIGEILMIAMIVALLAVLVMIASLAIRSRDRRLSQSALLPDSDLEDPGNLSRPPGEMQVSAYEARALQLASAGNYRAAIRELLLGAMSWIERRGLIRYRRGLTNRDYLRAIWRTTEKRNAFAVIGLNFERIFFGRRDATDEMFRSTLQAFREAFREEETAGTAD